MMASGHGHGDRTWPRVPSVPNTATVVASGHGHGDRTRPRVPSVPNRPMTARKGTHVSPEWVMVVASEHGCSDKTWPHGPSATSSHSNGTRTKPPVPSDTTWPLRWPQEGATVTGQSHTSSLSPLGQRCHDEATSSCHVSPVTSVAADVASGGGHGDRTRPRVPSVTMWPQ